MSVVGATTADTPIVPGGAPVTLTVSTPGGTATATFDGTAGNRVSLKMSGVTIGTSSCCSAKVSIISPGGTSLVLPTSVGKSGGFIDTRTLPATGVYTILVDAEGTATGNITLTLYDVPPDVVAPITAGGAAVSVTTTIPGQNAQLPFTGAADQRVSLRMTSSTMSSAKVSILKPDGTSLASISVTAAGGFLDTKTLPTSGTYTLLVDPQTTVTGNMTLTLYDVPPDVTGTITIGGAPATVSTTVPGQSARVSFVGAANQRVSLKMTSVTATMTVSILRPDGTSLASQSVTTSGGFMDTKTLPVAGTYTILADPQSFATGSITLTLNDVPADVLATIAFGSSTSVTTTAPGQNARVTFDGVAGQAPTLNIAWSPSVCCLVKVSVLRPTGQTLAGPLSVGSTAAFLDVPALPVTGTYTILVDPTDGAVGTTTLTLNNVPDVTGTITPNGPAVTVTTTSPGQDARLTFPASGGDGVALTIGPSCCNVSVSILRPDGSTQVAPRSFGTAGGTLTTSLPAAVSGTYTIVVDYSLSSTGSVTLLLKIDNVPPTAPVLTITEASVDSYVSGTSLYYRPTATVGSSFTVSATTSDAGSGVQKVRFPGLGGGMSPATALDDTSSPYSRAYSWTAGATYNNANNTVTAFDTIGNTSTAAFAVFPDSTPPNTTDDTAAIGSGWKTTTQVVTLTPIDTGAGVAATYYTTNGTTPTTLSPTGTTITLSADGVYTIKYFSTDNVGNVEPVRTAGAQIRIDKTAPTSTFTFPVAGRAYNPAGWNAGCAAPGLCGTASDASSGVGVVEVSILRASTGMYWDGTAFASASPMFFAATGTTSWSYGFNAASFPGDGSYTVSARATDVAGNVQTATSRTFTIDTAPPDTTITASPPNPSNASGASFSFTATEAGSTFQCRMDGAAFAACTSPRSYTLTAGTHTFEVRATDAAGNVDPTPATYTWTIDTTAPNTTITSSPTSPTNSTSANFTFTSTEPGTFECRLDGGTFAVCTSPRSYTGLAAGSHTFEVRARDTAGNVDASPATFTWTIDLTAPNTTITASPSNPTNATNASFSFSSTEAGTFECRLDGAAFAACTSPRSYTGLAAGSHTFEVRATDNAGNTDPTPASFTWTIDLTSPDTTITSTPSNPSNSTSASFTFTSNEPGTFECRLDGAVFAVCTSPRNYTGLAAGSHTFDVRARDSAGNLDPTPASYTWTIDTTAPNTTITSSPANPTTSTSASFTFTSTEPGTFECRLDGAPFAACTSPAGYSGLADGSHTFEVRALDTAGNADPTPASFTWIVDTAAPNTSITSSPPNPSNSAAASFSFTSTEPGTFECSLDGAAFTACTSPASYSGLAGGSHTFEVRARDAAGNTDATPASFTWTIDLGAPDTAIDSGPPSPTSSGNATFTFSSEPGATFECRLDGAAFAACTSPHGYTGLAAGSHTFEARAKDAAGNVDPTPASYTWTIDTTAPDTTISSAPPSTTTSTDATFVFSSEPGATFECRLDGAAFAACSSPVSYTGLAAGSHTFEVRATDTAGNTDPTPATWTWTIDATPPDTSITSGPASPTSSTSATFLFTATESGTFECSLDGGPFALCTSPFAASGLAAGAHTFEVRATDAAGNTDPSPASHGWTIDTTEPDTAIDTGPSGTVTSASATFTFSSEPGATFDCRLDGAAFAACTSPQGYTGLSDGSHSFEVRAKDAAGNTDSSPAARSWAIDTAAPETTIDSGPSGTVTTDSATFAFSSEPGAGFECSLDGAAFSICTSPQLYTGFADGAHTFAVRATDTAGNADPSPATRAWTVDTTAPNTTLDSAPADPSGSTDAAFGFSSEPGATFECSLDGAAFAACTSPQSYTGLAVGGHAFEVRAKDAAGNTDATPASHSWTIDTAAPDTAIDSGPTGTVTTSSATFAFSSEPGASFECSLNGAAFSACTSPKDYTGLADGSHTFEVRAKDAAGNTDTTPAARSWTIDGSAPDTTLDSTPPNPSGSSDASFAFSSEPGATFECSLDGAPFAACTSPHAYTGLADGSHTFEVRASDGTGNTDATPASWTWTVDTSAPETTLDSGPPDPDTSTDPTFTFSSEPGATFECSLDGAAYAACTSPQGYTGLAAGSHTFEVRAVDAAGNRDGTPAAHTWTIAP